MNNPEHINHGEIKIGNVDAAEKQAEKLRKLESSVESSPEHNRDSEAHSARKSAEAIFAQEAGKEHRSGGEPTASATVIRKITKKEKDRAYKQTLARAQSEMSAPQRAFSKMIHAPIVERSSEVVGSTIARPNALLSGSIVAFMILTVMYVVARQYGYHLSGFEMIGSYALGWVIGLTVDYVRLLATGKTA